MSKKQDNQDSLDESARQLLTVAGAILAAIIAMLGMAWSHGLLRH